MNPDLALRGGWGISVLDNLGKSPKKNLDKNHEADPVWCHPLPSGMEITGVITLNRKIFFEKMLKLNECLLSWSSVDFEGVNLSRRLDLKRKQGECRSNPVDWDLSMFGF